MPFVPRILYGGLSVAEMPICAALGINAVLDNGFPRMNEAAREAFLQEADLWGIKINPIYTGIGGTSDANYNDEWTYEENIVYWRQKFIEDYKDDPRMYCWYLYDEPEDRGAAMVTAIANSVRAYDPPPFKKPMIILWDQDEAEASTCQAGQYDLTTMDTWYSGAIDGDVPGDGKGVEAFRARIALLDASYRWRQIGQPVIAHFYKYEALEDCYDEWVDFFTSDGYDIPVVGSMYYNEEQVFDNPGAAARRLAIEKFHNYLESPRLYRLGGSFSFEKSLTADLKYRKVYKFIAGSLTMTKSLVKSLFYPLSGSVTSSGSLKKLLYSAMSGVLSLAGDLDTPFWETIKKDVSGSLTFASTLTHKIVKKLLGLISYGKYKYSDLNNLLWSQLETLTWDQLQSFDAGSLTKKVKLALAGGMVDGFAPRGYIMGKTPSLRACEKTWSFIQTLTWTQFQEYFWCKHILYVRSLGGGVGMSGTPGRHLQKPLSGSFGFNPAENLFLKVKPVLSSALSLGGVAKRLIHFLTTGVSNLTGSPKIKALLTASGGINLYGKVSTGVGALRKLLYKLIQLIERHGV